jgi:class 3 adenylate cyclase
MARPPSLQSWAGKRNFHGGEVVVSQDGDIRRAIGIWGDVINIAARLEQAGRELARDRL